MSKQPFNPRDLVSPPWETCPKCGRQQFGVGLISGAQLMRRCRDCWHKEHYPLPPLHKKIVYLDQFVISSLMKLDNSATKGHASVKDDPFWLELKNLLFQLSHLQVICCPDSHSHEQESRTSPFNAELKKTYEALSTGITFSNFESIESRQIATLARAWAEGIEPTFDFDAKGVLSSDPNKWQERFYMVFGDNPFVDESRLRQRRTALHTEIARLFKDVWAKENRDFEYWYDAERAEFQNHTLRLVLRHRKERADAIATYHEGTEASLDALETIMPSYQEALLAGLEDIFRFSRDGIRPPEKQLELATTFFQQNRIADAPFVKLQSLMFAALAMRAAHGQKQAPNQGTTTDVETVAHLLPYCDAMFMDNGCRSLLLDIPQRLRPADAAKVYSLNVKDEFLRFLRSLRDSITVEHVQAIRQVYGEKFLDGVPAAVS